MPQSLHEKIDECGSDPVHNPTEQLAKTDPTEQVAKTNPTEQLTKTTEVELPQNLHRETMTQ